MITTIQFSKDETELGEMNKDTLERAVRLFKADGALVLENVFPADFIEELHEAFITRYSEYFAHRSYANALNVGNKRTMVTVRIEDPFNASYFYANPLVYQIVREVLGADFILNGFGGVVSLPGAEQQKLHRDSPPLYGEYGENDIEARLPCFGLTVVVPLVNLNEVTGSTRLYQGTHRLPWKSVPYVVPDDPVIPVGSCFLMDYTLVHGGMPNRSDRVRPIMYNIYSRPWFRDAYNYKQQQAVAISQKELEQVPEEYRHLFDWLQHGRDPKAVQG